MSNYAPTSSGLLQPLQPWLNDKDVSEILINKPKEIYVEKAGELKRHEVPELNERALNMLFQLIANQVGRHFTQTDAP